MAAPSISELSFELRREDDELRQLFRALLSPADIADLLEVPYYYLVRILYLSPHRYQYDEFTIPKRSGGTRLICAPPPAILALQTKLNRILRLVYKPRASTHGFVENRSILTNAQSHTSKRFVLNLDLSDFFPSINFGRIRGLFLAKPYLLPEDAATLIAQICSHNGSLPQGAPTSPVISNMICWKLDRELEKLAHYNKCTYTRYADDITFSTSMKRFPANIATPTLQDWTERGVSLGEPLAQIVSSNGFQINAAKVRMHVRNLHQEVTGLTVNRFPNVDREFVRTTRAMLHQWSKDGRESAQDKLERNYARSHNPDLTRPDIGNVVRGRLDFIRMVKGSHHPTFRRMWNKLHELDPTVAPYQLPVTPTGIADGPPDQAWRHWFRVHRDSVFMLEVNTGLKLDIGSAFLMRNGLLATCAHVVDAGSVALYLGDGRQPVAKNRIRHHTEVDKGVDAALVEAQFDSYLRPRWMPTRSDPVQVGELVAVLGYPSIPRAVPELALVDGAVLAKTTDYLGVEHLVVSARFSGGMSGGPVIDQGGRLVGVAMQKNFEQVAAGVPSEPFYIVLPIHYVLQIDSTAAPTT